MPRHAFRLLAAVGLLTGLSTAAVDAAELKVVVALAMRAPLEELAPVFEKSSGHKLKLEYDTAGKVADKVAGEDAIDVAILPKQPFDKAVRAAKMVGGTTTALAQVPIAVAVKKGAPKPDISSVEAFKKTLASAKGVAHGDPAQGGAASQHVAQMLEKLGIAELKGKTKLFAPAGGKGFPEVAAEMLQKGESDIALLPISELQRVQGIDIVGPLPAELQSPDLTFFAGTPWSCEHPLEAKAFVDFLRSEQAKEVYKAKGLEPVKPAASG